MTTKDGRRAPGTLEAEVMALLWERGEPLTATEVHAALGDGLAYNTVQTILIRLYEKKTVERHKAGRGHAYWPVQDAATAAASRMKDALAGLPDRKAVLLQFAASLDEADADLLRQMLADMPRPTE